MKKKAASKNMEVARLMPSLYHSIPGAPFDIRKSEVVQWLVKNPDILNYIWNNIKNSGAVVFDSKSGKWQGVDYDD